MNSETKELIAEIIIVFLALGFVLALIALLMSPILLPTILLLM